MSARPCHAFVTGGGRGIGRAIALALAGSGADVTVTFHERSEPARAVTGEIQALGRRAAALSLDVGQPADVRAAFEKAQDELGPIDVLVNNGAMIQEKPFSEISVEDWDRMQAVNLRGPFLCCQQVMDGMLARRFGRIVNLTSIGGQWGGTRQGHYACAKSGVIGLTRSLARLGAERNVTVNAIAPGLVATDMTRSELASAEGRSKLAAIPAGRVGTVDEVAAAVAYLVSEGAAYVTGQTLNVNGGMLFR